MARIARFALVLICLLSTVLSPDLLAADVTITGTQTFASLDGSAQDADGMADGTFTVAGNLTVEGTLTCSDNPPLHANASACAIRIAASGNVVVRAGGAIVAENAYGSGNGGNIEILAGGDITLDAAVGLVPGGRISSSNLTSTSSTSSAGNITLNGGDTVRVGSGAAVAANAATGSAGAIAIDAQNPVTIDGLVLSGPSSTVLATAFNSGRVLAVGGSQQQGGAITIKSATPTGPAVVVSGTGRVVTQGEKPGGANVLLEGCGLDIRGLVASISHKNASTVRLRSGGGIVIDGQDLHDLNAPTGRFGQVRAELEAKPSGSNVLLLAEQAVQVFGPTSSSRFAVSSNAGTSSKPEGGTITVMSLGETVTASGNAFSASAVGKYGQGGTIDVRAAGAVNLDTAVLLATGDYVKLNGADTGQILVRSYANGISWQNGVGDVRPFGPTPLAQRASRITLAYCTTVSTAGSSFPTDATVPPPFPATVISCSAPEPSLPPGETVPECMKAPVGNDDFYSTNIDTPLIVPAPGVLLNDTGTQPLVASGPVTTTQGGTLALDPDGGFTYTPPLGFSGNDTFTYTVSNVAGIDTAVVTISVVEANNPPTAVDDSATMVEDGGATPIDVLANDTDPDLDTLTIISVTQPANGQVVITNSGADLTYQPDADYCNNPPGTTPDTFTYTVNDGNGGQDTATVSVTVDCVDDNPVAVSDMATVAQDSVDNTIAVLANDTDVDGGTKEVVSVDTTGTNGTVVIAPGGTHVTYTPNAGYCNNPPGTTPDTFTYTLNGGSTATVSISVICPGEGGPTAAGDVFAFIGNTELRVDQPAGGTPAVIATTVSGTGVLNNDTGDDPFVITGIIGCSDTTAPYGDSPTCATANGGTVVLESTGTFKFFPKAGDTAAGDSFQYVISDGIPSIGTVTLSRFARVWYVNNTAVAGGAGRSHEPFDTLAEAQTASVAGDYIFVYEGDGTSTGQSAGIILKQDQHLIGEHAGLSIPVALNGNPSPTDLVAASPGDRPLIDNVGGNAVAATNAIPTEIVGLSLSGANAVDLTTTGVFAVSDTVTISENVVRSSTLEGIDVTLAGTGTVTVNITGNSWTSASGGNGIDVVQTAGVVSLNVGGNVGVLSSATGVNGDVSGGSLTATVTNNSLTNNNVGVSLSTAFAGNLNFDVSTNTATGNQSHGLNVFVPATATGTVKGKFVGNTVGTLGVAGSGSATGFGIRVQNEGVTASSAVTVLVSGNTVQEVASFAAVNVNQGSTTTNRSTNVTITNNVITKVDAARAIVVQQNNLSAIAGATCANIAGNDMSLVAGSAGDLTKIRLRQLTGGTFNVTQKQATLAIDPDELDDANSVGANITTPAQISTAGTISYNAGVCPLP